MSFENATQNLKRVIINQPMQDGHTVYDSDAYSVGVDGVTSIQMSTRNGPMCVLACIEVWKGDHLHAEYMLHNIVGVEYMPPRGSQ